MSREEQAKYYEKARQERQLHMQLYPGWSARDNYGYGSKKKKRKKDRSPAELGGIDHGPGTSRRLLYTRFTCHVLSHPLTRTDCLLVTNRPAWTPNDWTLPSRMSVCVCSHGVWTVPVLEKRLEPCSRVGTGTSVAIDSPDVLSLDSTEGNRFFHMDGNIALTHAAVSKSMASIESLLSVEWSLYQGEDGAIACVALRRLSLETLTRSLLLSICV